MLAPIFIKGHVWFSLDGHKMEYTHQSISTFGAMGLKWEPMDPREHFGRVVAATFRLLNPSEDQFECQATLVRESSIYSTELGVQFELEPEQKEKLAAIIRRHGFYPTSYMRKYPRIPADPAIRTFPLHILGRLSEDDDVGGHIQPVIFNIRNLSPNGALISTENQNANAIEPGHRLDLLIEPRGWFPIQVTAKGLVCRVLDQIDPVSGNTKRSLGVKFISVDEMNRAAFIDLLKDILEKMKVNRS